MWPDGEKCYTLNMKTEAAVAIEFCESLVIPELKPPQQILLCPVGLVGAGKTTVVKPISEALDAVRISSDELRKRLKESGFDYTNLKELLLPIVTDLFKAGHSIALDMDCGSPTIIEAVRSYEAKGCKAFWLRINTPKEFIFQKFRNHPPSWLADNPQQMIENYEAQAKVRAEANFAPDYFYTFDTSQPDLPEKIADCIEKMKPSLQAAN